MKNIWGSVYTMSMEELDKAMAYHEGQITILQEIMESAKEMLDCYLVLSDSVNYHRNRFEEAHEKKLRKMGREAMMIYGWGGPISESIRAEEVAKLLPIISKDQRDALFRSLKEQWH